MEDQPPAQEVKWAYRKELTLEQRDQMHKLVVDYNHHFVFGMHDLCKHTTHQMCLNMIDSKPMICTRHRLSWVEWDIIDNKVKELA